MTRRGLTAVAVLAAVAFGCADDGNDGEPAGRLDAERTAELAERARADAETRNPPATTIAPTGVVHRVVALDNTFRPQLIEIAAGDEVLWENRGINEHDVLYVDSDDWGVTTVDFQPGDVYVHRFSAPGEYRYYCSIHGNEDVGMVGTIVVTG